VFTTRSYHPGTHTGTAERAVSSHPVLRWQPPPLLCPLSDLTLLPVRGAKVVAVRAVGCWRG
jgi:hypothetical protein